MSRSPSLSPVATSPAPQLEYAGTVYTTSQDGDATAVAVKFGDMSVGEAGAVPAGAVRACINDPATVSRSVFVPGQVTVTLTSNLPAHVQLKVGSTFDPVLLPGEAGIADNAEGAWQCGARLWQFDRSLTPGQPVTFDFVLVGDVLTANHPKPSQDLLNAWAFGATVLSAGLYPKVRVEGPHVARCTGLDDQPRLSVLAKPPYSFREPKRTSFGAISGGVRKCTAINHH